MKILSTMQDYEKISTNSPLDELLDGGIDKRTITQIYGPPGVGKTNVSLNIAVNVARSGKKVIYIDTEGGISVERIKQISGEDFDNVAKNIVVFEPTSFKEQEEDLELIEDWLASNNSEVELIVLDSAVALFRVEDDKSRSHLLGKQMQQLAKFAVDYDLAVLVTNQIYASFEEDSDEMAPVGGTIIQYRSKIIIELKREEGSSERIAILKRHKTRREGLAIHFSITNNGIE
ncbi:DNA repair and recombination protein RadB [Methanobrevibacter ruminantium M1]|uniref:DNA repair and recombination protein RadB n=1 Tax=Methanobrevibacter ruminantium (strain ATCC 35063 / DSM 1093 / JCM 13430 / OCM 146 / M1) TaxID=634498 RepID=D3E173_METRM|nr:DNA repair and recombination protein RadB [Methanobrevibacter ruminantium]ADC46356.1 DNA repair and recombination protein RadB [Methanobrevibacter ruminantium M1]